jgi:hypothetical protein
VPLDKIEGVVKADFSWAVREHRWFSSLVREVEDPERRSKNFFMPDKIRWIRGWNT